MSRILFLMATIGIASWFGLIIMQGQNLAESDGSAMKILRVKDGRAEKMAQIDSSAGDSVGVVAEVSDGVGGLFFKLFFLFNLSNCSFFFYLS